MGIYKFKLSMPNTGSWNGQWSGRSKNYTTSVRTNNKETIENLKTQNSWHYNFGDGWSASIVKLERTDPDYKRKSDGFCGYGWMVESILKLGIIHPGYKTMSKEVANCKNHIANRQYCKLNNVDCNNCKELKLNGEF